MSSLRSNGPDFYSALAWRACHWLTEELKDFLTVERLAEMTASWSAQGGGQSDGVLLDKRHNQTLPMSMVKHFRAN